jgi:hypothetical protein
MSFHLRRFQPADIYSRHRNYTARPEAIGAVLARNGMQLRIPVVHLMHHRNPTGIYAPEGASFAQAIDRISRGFPQARIACQSRRLCRDYLRFEEQWPLNIRKSFGIRAYAALRSSP